MGLRSDLHKLLSDLINPAKVYFQAPSAEKMSYPCIVYEWSNANTIFADNNPYSLERRYSVMVIDANPDSDIPGKVALLPKCVFDRHYAVDSLHHFVFRMYF